MNSTSFEAANGEKNPNQTTKPNHQTYLYGCRILKNQNV